MNYKETIDYIESVLWMGSRPGLSRMTRIMKMMGNPQDGMKFVHVTGTKGKGSFCAMTESILRAAGYKTGLYVSPYVFRFNEQMRVNGIEISDNELAEITTYVKGFADNMGEDDKLTEFELKTAIGFEYFHRHECDVVVLEVGMGGRLDATNIIKEPLLSVITGISLDHTEYLGDTVEKIAYEKSGIIKPLCPTHWGGMDKAAEKVVADRAAELASPFNTTDYSKLSNVKCTLDGSDFDFDGYKNLHINLLGLYQIENAASVLCAIPKLRERGLDISDEAIRRGLESTVWQARFEKLSKSPVVIYDGSHNPQSIEAAVHSIKALFGNNKVNILTGVMKDKDYITMVNLLKPVTRRAFTVTPDNKRALPSLQYAEVFHNVGVQADAYNVLEAGAKAAYDDSKATGVPLIILGSLYMYADMKKALNL